MSGHSKWANIKHRKEVVDKKRGSMFTKMSRELMVSARMGGSDSAMNARLRIAVSNARAANMPKDTIERAIKKGAGELEGQVFEEILYEIYAVGGVALIVEALTDKKSRTTPEIKSILNRMNSNLAEANAVKRLFNRCGFIAIQNDKIEEEKLMEIVIDAGADDIKNENGYYEIITAIDKYAAVSEALSAKNIETDQSALRYLPVEGTEVQVEDVEQARKNLKLIEAMEDHDDVQAVYHNMTLSDEVVDKLELG